MKKNIILGFVLAIFTVVGINAQDKDSQKTDHVCTTTCCVDQGPKFAPQKGDFTAQMLFGRGAFANYGVYMVPSSYTSSIVTTTTGGTISGQEPYIQDVSANDNDVSNMIGAEFRYYTSNKFAIKASAGAIIRNTPYAVNIPAVVNSATNAVIIPGYSAVDATEEAEMQITIGGEFLLKTKNERLFPYVGFALPFDYARKSIFTPASISETGSVTVIDTGARHYEVYAFSAQAVAGVDYYIAKDIFFGFEIKPVSYTYAASIKSAAPELRNLEIENSTVSLFANFNAKVGFKF